MLEVGTKVRIKKYISERYIGESGVVVRETGGYLYERLLEVSIPNKKLLMLPEELEEI